MCEIAIETNENELTLYNVLVEMNNNNNYYYSIQVKEHLKILISTLEKSLSKCNKYVGYDINDSILIRIMKLKKNDCSNKGIK